MKRTKKWLLAAAVLLLCGLALGIVGLAINGFRFEKLSTKKTVESEKTLTCPTTGLCIDTDQVDVLVCPSESDTVKMQYVGSEEQTVSTYSENGVLHIDCKKNEDAPLQWFSIGPADKLTVYLPARRVSDLSVNTESGSIELQKGLDLMQAELSSSSGNIDCHAAFKSSLTISSLSGSVLLENTTAGKIALETRSGNCRLRKTATEKDALSVTTRSGNIKLKNCTAGGELHLHSESGNIRLSDCDGASIRLESESGSIKGSVVRPMIFNANTSSGRLRLPGDGPTGAPVCTIRTQSGSVTLTITED